MGIVDSHCHLNFEPMGDNLAAVIAAAQSNDVQHMLCVAVTIEDFPQVLKIAQDHEFIYASVGVHPCYKDSIEPTVEELVNYADDKNIVAIGETGLDYFRNEGDLDWQRERFVRHIEAGIIAQKPLIIHTREAAVDTMAMLKEHNADKCGAVMHCFAEDWDTAKKALDLGFYISMSGIVTFKSAETLKEVAKKIPMDRMLVETDSPYLAPVPMRGKPNQPAFVRHTAEYLAELRGLSLEEIAAQTTQNFFTLFNTAIPVDHA
ncbi:MAG: TatD DNase family protein [Saprospiraceae bacterium]|jgi:TatD DNase family protein